MDSTTSPYGTFYNEKFATADLRSYRKKGPNPWTRTLIEALKAEGVEGATRLDIGGRTHGLGRPAGRGARAGSLLTCHRWDKDRG